MAAGRRVNIRALSAVVGGGAVLALGWLGATSDGHGATLANHSPPPPPTATSASATLGATTTAQRPPTELATKRAQPKITGAAALPSEEAGLP